MNTWTPEMLRIGAVPGIGDECCNRQCAKWR